MPESGALGGGFTSGMLESQLDLQRIQLGGQEVELNKFRLQEAPIKLQEEQMQLQKDKIALAQQVRMLSLMQNLHPPQDVNSPDALSGVFTELATIQLESGMPDAAAKTASTAAKLADTASKVDSRIYRMQNDRLSKFANILDGVQDNPGGYAQAIQAMVAADPGVAKDKRFAQLAQQPWRPGMIEEVKRAVLTAKEQAEVDYRKKAGMHAEMAGLVDAARIPLIRAQTKLALDRDTKITKEGGTPVKASQLKTMTDLAEVDYPGADAADLRVRSRPLAEEMVRMVREQHLTESEAARRVYENARSSGVFTGLRVAPVVKGSKPGAPLPLPKDAKGVRQNQWYMVNGQPMIAMGSKFYTEAEMKASESEDEEEEDDSDAD